MEDGLTPDGYSLDPSFKNFATEGSNLYYNTQKDHYIYWFMAIETKYRWTSGRTNR